MRVTNNMLINNMTYNLNKSLQRLEKLQYEAAEGKKFRVPSDDPIGVSKSLKFNTDISKVEQYIRNTEDANSWMKETESALTEINSVLKRAFELTGQAANGTNSPDELEKINAEITELKGHLVQLGNSAYAGRTLFTGFATDQKLLDENGNYLINTKESEVFVYNIGVAETVNINTLGNKVFGNPSGTYDGDLDNTETNPGATTTEAHLINIFTKLQNALTNPDATASADGLQTALADLKASMSQVLSVTAEIGAKVNRLELTQNKLENQLVNLKDLLSFNEDVSLSDAMMNLAMEETAYQASLGVSGRIIQPSLMDFLR